jgi:hypothetical protein
MDRTDQKGIPDMVGQASRDGKDVQGDFGQGFE